MRAVAALLVVWSHSIDGAELFAAPRQALFFHWRNFGPCGVDIFFVISGFVVSQVALRAASQRGGAGAAKHFLSRRITRIFPLYWILTAAIIVQGSLGHHRIQLQYIHWLPTLFLLPSVHYPAEAPLLALGWTLGFELYFYCILAAALVIAPRFLVRSTVLFLTAAVVGGAIVGIRKPILVIVLNPMIIEFVMGCIIGLLFGRFRSGMATQRKIGAALAALGTASLAATIFTGYGGASDAFRILAGSDCWLRVGVWGVPSALLVGGMTVSNPAMLSFPSRVLVFLGDASYSIYLCTVPSRSVVDYYWHYFGKFGADWGVFLGAMFCTVAGVICYLAVERPLMRFFHNWYKPLPFAGAGKTTDSLAG